jgi:hypothetical protein
MKIKLFWAPENTQELELKVKNALDELGLVDFIQVELTQDENLQKELNITKEPALVIEEEAIDFKDTIFEGITPENEEIKSMFISIIWGGSGWSCGSKDENGSCGTGCSC